MNLTDRRLLREISIVLVVKPMLIALGETQQTKLAAMEAMRETEPAPASFNLIAIPNEEEIKNDFAIHIPWAMGIISTRSFDKQLPGLNDILAKNRERIVTSAEAVKLLERLRADPTDLALRSAFDQVNDDLGFGLLLKKYVASMDEVTPELIDRAARDSIPRPRPLAHPAVRTHPPPAAAAGGADHWAALALFWSMSAGFIAGVGFEPHWLGWRLLFSSPACRVGLALAIARMQWLG